MKAAEVILKGKLHPAQEALQLGLVDEVVPQDKLLEAARKKDSPKRVPPEGRASARPGSPIETTRSKIPRPLARPKSSITA